VPAGHDRPAFDGLPLEMIADQIWTFARHDQRLELRRRHTPDGLLFEIHGDGPTRSYPFANLDALVPFHRDMEWFLLRTGWSLVGYSPERRLLRDRRKVLRTMSPDRRRTFLGLGAGS
jgi:hypothetical protein